MGYTQYWMCCAGRLPAATVALLQQILTAAYVAGVVRYEHDDPRPPVVIAAQVCFNGVGEQGHQTYRFDTGDRHRRPDEFRFDWCTTNRKPYDALVMKVLIMLKYYLGDSLKITSDGRFDDEWAAVRAEM